MSFDLCVFHTDGPLTYEQARDFYWRLCEDGAKPTERVASVDEFYRELSEIYPEIDDTPDEKLDRCPWSSSHDKSGIYVIVTIRGDRKMQVAPVVKKLAKKHGLAWLDPQGKVVALPDFPARQ